MRKILIAIFILATVAGKAQLNNSWIDYNKTYYRFKISANGVYRINQATLAALGLNNTPAEYFQMWRNGQEVRLFTSVPSGPFAASDYIEFWGKKNDGVPDKSLYLKPGYQLCDSFSLHTDTAAYFLTVNPFPGNLRFSNAVNDVANNTLPADNYFFRTVANPYKAQYNRGYAVQVGEFVYSSSYDIGEGWTSLDVAPGLDLYQNFDRLNVYTAGPANSVSLHIAAFGNALNVRNIRVKFFNTEVFATPMSFFDTVKKRIDNIPLNLLSNPDFLQTSVGSYGTNINPFDRFVVANIAITYPAKFNFNGSSNFYFELNPSSTGNYLVIDNFNYGTTAPVLYSMNDGNRYTGDISVAGKVRFALPPSLDASRKFMLVSEEAANVKTLTAPTTRNFINYNQAANQGDYLIISNPVLYNDGAGNNYVNQYRQYRSTAAGGGFNAKVVDIDELYDQFSFGILQHPAAIRDFIRFAYRQFSTRPQYVLLIGRGVTSIEYKKNEANPDMKKIEMVPTFGWPASDILLACEPSTNLPLVPIGRLSAINGTEIKHYLDKVIEYEQVQVTQSCNISDREWMKRILHVVGGANAQEDVEFTGYMNGYANIIEDSLYGGHVETFRKTSSAAVEQASGERIQQLINEGVGLIGYFGHSSANTLAFNLTSPDVFNNQGKYPFFNISGCSAGNFFTFDPLRASGGLSISEKYVLADHRGSIGFLGSTHLGIPPFLNAYNMQLYNVMSRDMYGSTIGKQVQRVLQNMGGANSINLDFYSRIHLEEINLHGDPAVKVNYFAKPDYAIEDASIKFDPSIITVADNSFTLKVKVNNIGRAANDSIRVVIQRKLPNDSIQYIYDQVMTGIGYGDSLLFTVPINPITDKGLNKVTVTVDADNRSDESCETNNVIVKEFYILEDEVRPVAPYNYSIVNQQGITFTASTANPLSEQRQYLMEIDTTELFNTAFKKQYTASGGGGIIQFNPSNLTFTDSTVYYWRTAMVPLNGGNPVWNSFSFIYLPNGGTGFNQSHYYQHKKSSYTSMSLDNDGVYRFATANRNLQIKTGLYPYTSYDRISVILDFDQFEQYGCKYGSLQFLVYDSIEYKPWTNYNVDANNGRFGSWKVCSAPRKIFEFPYGDPVYRKRAMDFIDSIPDGMYVSITNLGLTSNTSFIDQWKADDVLGTGNSLYHKLKNAGFTKIDSFTRNLPFVFFFRKNTPAYVPKQYMGSIASDQIEANIPVSAKYKSGKIESPAFGPAKNWTALHWRAASIDPLPGDTSLIDVVGVRADGTENLMATVRPATDTSLSFISAATYPYIKLRMQNTDNVYATPYQLKYWRINADYIPEGAVAPNILFRMKDSVEQGEHIDFALAFKNISTVAFDSLRIKFVITDRNNVPHTIDLPKRKPLVAGDTITVSYSIDTRSYPGKNTLYVMVNPENDQPEQYLYNNFIYKDFYVNEDLVNPLLDVTFDGVHILSRDIVAAKPHILIKLKDENRFMALSDTSLLKVSIRMPDGSGTVRRFYFGDSLRFTPATLGNGDNTATIDFTPALLDDGEYELIVSDGRDVVGNKAGNLDYRVAFSVINKAMISNLLNYPNPFTTSTAFVFTITGSEVPQNMRIQILTVTGKVVREITKAELGDLHVGTNITEFKWDGTDMYGSKLANGVYLYRVITNMNGKALEKYKAEGDNTDKYFKAGYGKMYLMR